ncbi:hypothetical protein M758_6G152300 [Ceratodon purpureus]|nr:hypothetical protein M758_6G152200 [Ceratodon purpureus]KAG0614119.1 hypothetical protein M758_6G152300 [Ceratodon purpureus]
MMRCKFSIFCSWSRPWPWQRQRSGDPTTDFLRSPLRLVVMVGAQRPARGEARLLVHDGLVLVGLGRALVVGLHLLHAALVARALLAQERAEQRRVHVVDHRAWMPFATIPQSKQETQSIQECVQ